MEKTSQKSLVDRSRSQEMLKGPDVNGSPNVGLTAVLHFPHYPNGPRFLTRRPGQLSIMLANKLQSWLSAKKRTRDPCCGCPQRTTNNKHWLVVATQQAKTPSKKADRWTE